MLLSEISGSSKYDKFIGPTGLDQNGYSKQFLEELEQVVKGPHKEMTEDDWDKLFEE